MFAGSGCYNYECKHGRLHILISNYTFECYYAGQELDIRILQNNWLHHGSIICPPCAEICGSTFSSIGETCKHSEEAPSSNFYPKDHLKCKASLHTNFSLILVVIVYCFFRNL